MKLKQFLLKQIVDIKTHGQSEVPRKIFLLIKLFGIILLDIFAIIPCIIIRLISPWCIIRVEKLSATNFGPFIDHTAMYYCKKRLKIKQPKKKCIDLVYIHYKDKVFNKQIEKMWRRKLNFLSPYILDPISRVNNFIPGGKVHTLDFLSGLDDALDRDLKNLFQKFKPILEFTQEEEIYGKKILKNFGLKEDDKFVCLNVRDAGYQMKKVSPRYRDWSYHEYRNFNIDNFILAAEELTKRGYYVFRMGTNVEKILNSKNPKIIDYANQSLRSDFMDIYLGANCSFCISTGSGFLSLCGIFGKPNAQITVPFAASHTHNENYLLMTKHHILKREKRELSLSELFSYGVAYAFDSKIYAQKGIELVENTPEEIKDLALEAADNFESTEKLTPEDEDLKNFFKELFAKNYKIANTTKDLNPLFWKNIHSEIKATYSKKFLKENKNWLR